MQLSCSKYFLLYNCATFELIFYQAGYFFSFIDNSKSKSIIYPEINLKSISHELEARAWKRERALHHTASLSNFNPMQSSKNAWRDAFYAKSCKRFGSTKPEIFVKFLLHFEIYLTSQRFLRTNYKLLKKYEIFKKQKNFQYP